ncbi:DUF4397 domain-containing protein [Pedobacter caeni]|nr:DUF4397 domain-containing protein [Pedobacter caeni]
MEFFTRHKRNSFYRLMAVSLFSIGTILIQSCSTKETPVPEAASLMGVNTSPSPASYDMYINGQKATTSGALAFGGPTAYLRLNTGENTIKFTVGGSTESVVSKKINTENNKVYSLYLIDKGANMDILVANDGVSSLPTTKALIRFINLSPDAPALNLSVKDAETILTGKTYKAVTDFVEIEPKKYTFQIKDKATNPAMAELVDADIKAGGIYTLLSIGLVNPTGLDPKITTKLITNK